MDSLRFALRALRNAPLFTGIAVATLALGVAANTGIFSVFYQVLLRSLPVNDPNQLVLLHSELPYMPGGSSADNNETVFSYPMYTGLKQRSTAFLSLAARASDSAEVTTESGTDRVATETVSGNFFEVLGVHAKLGRLLVASDDDVRGGNPVAVLSHAYWVKHFGESAGALNQKIVLNGHPFIVVGVLPEKFLGFLAGSAPDLYVPLSTKPEVTPGWAEFKNPGSSWLSVFARLAPGITRERATASLRPSFSAIVRQEIDELNVKDQGYRRKLIAKTLQLRSAAMGINNLESEWQKPLRVLLAMACLLLLIACANVANLLVARGLNRNREFAVRVALGAGRWRIIRYVLAESLMLALAGGLLGTVGAFLMVRAIVAALPEDVAGHWVNAQPDPVVLIFSLALVVFTTLLFGLMPALQSARTDPMPALKEQSRASASRLHTRWRQALVAGQLALSVALLVGAGLFAKTLINLLAHDPGFRADHLLSFSIDPPPRDYSVDRGLALYREVETRLKALPGVEVVAMAQFGPLYHSEAMTNLSVEGYHPLPDEDVGSDIGEAGPGYFRTMGTPLISGREFEDHDRRGAQKVAVVNEAFVKRYLAKRAPLGTLMEIGAGQKMDIQIVGVTKDVNSLNLRDRVKPMFYVPLEQSYSTAKRIRSAAFFVRSRNQDETLERSIRSLVRSIDSNLPIYDVRSMRERVDESVYTEHLTAMLASIFGILATLLATIGLYGVVAYSVVRRTVEIGVRQALGALPMQVVRLVMAEVLALAALGVVAGIPLAYGLARLMSSQLFGVQAESWEIFTAATIAILLAAAIAGFVPAYRATGIDPKTALHYE